MVFAVGPLGCIPSQIVAGNSKGVCIDRINAYSRGFNAAVRPMVAQLNSALPGAKFVYGDAYRAVSQFIADPAQFGKYPHPHPPPTSPFFLLDLHSLTYKFHK